MLNVILLVILNYMSGRYRFCAMIILNGASVMAMAFANWTDATVMAVTQWNWKRGQKRRGSGDGGGGNDTGRLSTAAVEVWPCGKNTTVW